MPLGRLLSESATQADALRTRLTAEWRLPGTDPASALNGQPVLIEDRGTPGRFGERPSTHLYVIWDEWEALSQQERSEVIMDAYENTHELPEVIRVTVAMGLTATEAQRMGLRYEVGSPA